MNRSRIKVYYFFRADLRFGVHFFEAWSKAVNNEGIPMHLITFLNIKKYLAQISLVHYYKKRGILIYPDLPYGTLHKIFFFFQCLLSKKLIIHLKKRNISFFYLLKKFFCDKIKLVYEGEGDPYTEFNYLEEHPFKKDFYNVQDLKKYAINQKNIFKKADLITFGYRAMKEMLVERYPNLSLEKKILLIPMTFSKGDFFYSTYLREDTRKKLNIQDRYTFIYTGNAYYSWQNVYRTLELFNLFRKKRITNAFIILLIKEADHYIVNEFLIKLGIRKKDYILKEVDHDKINKYLNAADIGVSLRHNHSLNNTTPSGKILEYLAAGLPVLTTKYMGEISKIVEDNQFGICLENMDNDNEFLNEISHFINIDKKRKIEISEWSNSNLSIESYIPNYTKEINKFLEG